MALLHVSICSLILVRESKFFSVRMPNHYEWKKVDNIVPASPFHSTHDSISCFIVCLLLNKLHSTFSCSVYLVMGLSSNTEFNVIKPALNILHKLINIWGNPKLIQNTLKYMGKQFSKCVVNFNNC